MTGDEVLSFEVLLGAADLLLGTPDPDLDLARDLLACLTEAI